MIFGSVVDAEGPWRFGNERNVLTTKDKDCAIESVSTVAKCCDEMFRFDVII